MVNGRVHQSRWRNTLYRIIFETDTPVGKGFDVVLIICILASVLVAMVDSVREHHQRYGAELHAAEWFFTVLFTIEYSLRLLCSPAAKKYAFSGWGLIDLLAILPTYIGFFSRTISYLRVIRILRVLRVFRILRLGGYLRQVDLLKSALHASRQKIFVFLLFILTLVVIIGAVMYLVEGPVNEGFANIPVSVYWTIVTLTTVGYGDISPVTAPGQFLAAIVMLLGYSIIAVPTGIVTAQMSVESSARTARCPNCASLKHDADAKYCKQCGKPLKGGGERV
jgi:voltage-gated potassium channel